MTIYQGCTYQGDFGLVNKTDFGLTVWWELCGKDLHLPASLSYVICVIAPGNIDQNHILAMQTVANTFPSTLSSKDGKDEANSGLPCSINLWRAAMWPSFK